MEIELIEQANNEIAEYNPVEAGLVELRSRLENVSYDVTTTKGMAVAKADRAEVRTLRTSLEAKRKEIKAPALAHCKLIDEEAKRITAELLKLETPIDEQIKARELVMEAERAAREAAEKARVMAITERIAGIRQYVELAASCRTSERIQLLQDKLAELVIEGFEEFQEEAELAWKQAGTKVEELLTAKLEQEAEQARIKTEQAEAAAKLAAERAEFAAQQALAKVEADKMAALIAERNAEFEAETKRQNDVLAADRAAQAAEQQRAFKEAKDAQDKLDAEHMAERKRFAEEKAAFEAQAANQAAEAKRVAEQAEEARIAALPVAVIEAAHQVNQAEEVAEPVFSLESELVPEFAEPSDADVMWEAIRAVAMAFNMPTEQATARLAAVQWTI